MDKSKAKSKAINNSGSDELFWADQLAKKIINRKKYRYLDKRIEPFKEYTVKTSASLSGVLHIGRLSDTIRCETVQQALADAGVKSRLIWVAENMDPLRRVPKGVSSSFAKYIGVAVTDVPDPYGCHESYAEHFTAKYFEVLDEFVFTKMKKYSMREEYRKGHFKPYIKQVMEKIELVKEIQNKYRTSPLPEGYSPWTPICENCGKIVTPKVVGVEDGRILYRCEDYSFEKTTAKGCGYEGENDPMKGEGKLMWKSEWAAQWARWRICSEGAGKEYQVPNSAFWVNAEIVEKVFDFPSPEPIFYEHLMIDGVKMSASLGNVVYPHDWLEVATPELLKLFYNKRLMKTRSFSWKDLPKLYDEYDYYNAVYLDRVRLQNKKEEMHIKRLFELSHGKAPVEEPLEMSFSHAVVVAQVFQKEADIVRSLRKTGHYSEEQHKRIFQRIEKARSWLAKYAPDEYRFEIQESVPERLNLSEAQKNALRIIAGLLEKREWDEKSLYEEFYSVSKKLGLEPKELFRAGYQVLLNRDRGPKLAPFILAIGKERVAKLFKQV